jgi:hypothetical protein
MREELELKMYFFVPNNISEKQKGIQAGHCALRYARAFAADDPMVWEFVDNHETWIILDGGTTNGRRDMEGVSIGTIDQIGDQLNNNDIKFSYFNEPDLNDALSALCFICDERVFNRKDYPNFATWLLDVKMNSDAKDEALKNNPVVWVSLETYPDSAQEMFPEYYKEWVRFMGGVKNVFLRNLIKDKKLA